MKNKKVKRMLTIVALVGILMIGSIMAYFTDADTATNTFTVGQVSLDLQEPNWDPDDAEDLVPNEEIQKDPQIKNDGVNDEYVFVEVIVPYDNISTVNDAGNKTAAADTELFSYDVNTGWVEVGSSKKDTGAKTVTHLYAYGTSSAMTALDAGDTTPTLFDSVRFVNITEGSTLEGQSTNIVINGYGIQTTSVNVDENGVGKTAPADVWAVLSVQTPSTTVDVTEDAKTDIKTGN